MLAPGTTWRAVAAWCVAWTILAGLGWLGEQIDNGLSGDWAPQRFGLWLLPSAMLFAVWAPYMRARQWRRPLADIVMFAVAAAATPVVVALVLLARGSESAWPSAHANAHFLGGRSAAAYAFYIAQLALAFGALGGLLYWLCAGRPRPPYQ